MEMTRVFENLKPALETVLASQVVNAWTALEALALDLWICCVNARPRALSDQIVGITEDEEKVKLVNAPKFKNPNELKSIPFHRLRFYGYDMRNRMGDYLESRFNFNRLDGIREAYAVAFRKFIAEKRTRDIGNMGEEDVKQFEQLEQSALDDLEALRNVIVHNGGVADASFMGRIGKSAYLSKSEKDKPVIITPALAGGLCNVVVNYCLKLLWMADHVLTETTE